MESAGAAGSALAHFGTSSLTLAAVQVDATVSADTMVLDEPTVVLTDLDSTARAVETDNASENIGETIGMVVPEEPKTVDGKDDGIQHQTDANRSPSEIDDAAGTSVLDEPGSMADILEEAETPTENVHLPKPNGGPPGTAALDKPLVSADPGKTGFTPTSAAGEAEIPQSTAANLPDGSVPVPAKRPWDTLSDEMAAAYVAPAPIPAARPDPQPQPEPAQKLAEQPDGSIVDIGSSATSAPSIATPSAAARIYWITSEQRDQAAPFSPCILFKSAKSAVSSFPSTGSVESVSCMQLVSCICWPKEAGCADITRGKGASLTYC
jgi:hypothetical protein